MPEAQIKQFPLTPSPTSEDKLEFYQEITVLASLNKRSYQLTALINSDYFSVCLWLSESQYFVCLFIYYYFNVVPIMYKKQLKTCQEESTSNRNKQEA